VENGRTAAEKMLIEYLGEKHEPARGPTPLVVDILVTYGWEHAAHIATARNSFYNLQNLGGWWDHKRLSEVNALTCRDYARSASSVSMARRDLELLRAAI
jgi:hypothetical protein